VIVSTLLLSAASAIRFTLSCVCASAPNWCPSLYDNADVILRLGVHNGAVTNLKVAGGGHRSGTKRRKIFLVVPLHFLGSKSTVGRFGEHFRDGQHSLVSLLFAVGGVAQWLGCRSVAGGLSLICA